MLPEVSDFVHVAVEASALLELTADLVVAKVTVAALSDVNLGGGALVVTILSLEVVKLLSQFCNECIFLTALDLNWFVSGL